MFLFVQEEGPCGKAPNSDVKSKLLNLLLEDSRNAWLAESEHVLKTQAVAEKVLAEQQSQLGKPVTFELRRLGLLFSGGPLPCCWSCQCEVYPHTTVPDSDWDQAALCSGRIRVAK